MKQMVEVSYWLLHRGWLWEEEKEEEGGGFNPDCTTAGWSC